MEKLRKLTYKLLLGVCALTLSGCVDYSKYPHVGDEVEILKFYKAKAESVEFADTVTTLNVDGEQSSREYNGYYFVKTRISLAVNNSDDAKPIKLESNDFKLKDHVGVAQWSSFSTIEAVKDYSWCDKTISKGESFSFVAAFQFKKSVDLNGCRLVLEADLSNAPGNGVDIVLSENAASFRSANE